MSLFPPPPAAFMVMVKSCVYGVPCAVPFAMVALTVTVPAAVALRVFPLIVAEPLTTDQAMVLLVAVEGTTVPVSVNAVPAVAVAGTPVMSVTATKSSPLSFAKVVVPLPLIPHSNLPPLIFAHPIF